MIVWHSALWIVMASALLAGFGSRSALAQGPSGTPGSSAGGSAALPKDVYPDSGFRLPLPKREDLDEQGKKVYDAVVGPNSRTLAGLRGPSGIRLYSSPVAEHEHALNQYLRYDSGLSGRLRELAILATAREMNSQIEWTAHEPVGLQEGLPQEMIDVVKYRKSLDGLPETEAVIIELGRQMFGQRKVTSETFARALKLFGPRGLVNLVSLMAGYSAAAALLTAFDMQLLPNQKPRLPLP